MSVHFIFYHPLVFCHPSILSSLSPRFLQALSSLSQQLLSQSPLSVRLRLLKARILMQIADSDVACATLLDVARTDPFSVRKTPIRLRRECIRLYLAALSLVCSVSTTHNHSSSFPFLPTFSLFRMFAHFHRLRLWTDWFGFSASGARFPR